MVDLADPLLLTLAVITSFLAVLGGFGGAVFLVPALTLLGVEPALAVPLGALSVAASSVAAAPRHLDDGLVHHRLGITLETAASSAAIVGAVAGEYVSARVLAYVLAAAAGSAAVLGLRHRGMRNLPRPEFAQEQPGEWPGTLAGAYRLGDDEIVPYQARRVPLGLLGMAVAGLISGLAGVGGGFIKTPVMNEVMHVPVRVAAATSTFTVGITAAVSLLVFAGQDRIDLRAGAAVLVGGVAGGLAGARVQTRLHPRHVRRVVTMLLGLVAVILVVRA